jgi:hypothetical protein
MTDVRQTVQQLERALQQIEQNKNNPQQIDQALQEARQHLAELKRQQ